MASKLNPYLNFRGEAQAALDFYHSVFGGELAVDTFSGFGMPTENPAEADWVMHGQLDSPAGFTLMASDVPPEHQKPLGGFSVSYHAADEAEAERVFAALAGGGTVTMPLAPTFWAKRFGMLVDRFGVPWMVNCAAPVA